MAAARSRRSSLTKMRPMWLLTVTPEMKSSSAISAFERPLAISVRTSSSRAVSSAKCVVVRRLGGLAVGRQHARGDRRVEIAVSPGHRPHRADQFLGRRVLEHEAGRAGAQHAGEQFVVVEGGQRQYRRAAVGRQADASLRCRRHVAFADPSPRHRADAARRRRALRHRRSIRRRSRSRPCGAGCGAGPSAPGPGRRRAGRRSRPRRRS